MASLTAAKKKAFLEALRKTLSPTAAADAIGMSRTQVYNWRKRDPEFAAEWEEAQMTIVDRLEASMMRRAIEGYNRPVFQEGRLVGHERVHHPQLAIFMLKMNRQEKYGDNIRVTVEAGEYAKQVRDSLREQDEAAQRALEGLAPVSNRALEG